MEPADQAHEMPSELTPLIPCFVTNVIGHPIKFLRGTIWRSPAMPPRPLSGAAGIRAFPGRVFAEVVRLEVDLLQAVAGPVLAEVQPLEIGLLRIIPNNPESSKLPRSLENGRS